MCLMMLIYLKLVVYIIMQKMVSILVAIVFLGILVYYQKHIVLAIIGLLIFALLALIYFKQNSLLYMPVVPGLSLSPKDNPRGYRHPTNQGLKTKDLQLITSDKDIIRGWHISNQNSDRVLIYFHQNAGNIGTRIPYIRHLCQSTNSDVILVAYRGYSDSQGQPSEQNLQKDAKAIVDYGIDIANEKKIELFLLGRSLGGAVNIYITSQSHYQSKISGIILENTFTSISDMVDSIFPVLSPFKFLQKNHWKSLELIDKIKIPIMFIMSMKDQLVPPEQMQRLIQKVSDNKNVQIYKISEGTHNSSWEIEPIKYFDRLNKFFNKIQQKDGKVMKNTQQFSENDKIDEL